MGERAALAARRVAYGETRVAAVGPVFRAAQPEGAALRVAFDYVGGGLETRDRRPPVGLQVAGEDRRFVPAEARLDGATLLVSARDVPAPAAVRYLWDAPAGRTPNLVNREGLPASPFRSDAWE